MQTAPVKQTGRVVSWMVAVVFGLSGTVDLVTGVLGSERGLVLYGLGSVMIGSVFVLSALRPLSLQTKRARIVRLVLGYCGLAVAICGFVMKYRGIS